MAYACYMEDTDHFFPGYQDYDQHYTTARQIRSIPRYDCYEDSKAITINDPVWGKENIGDWPGDEIFTELYLNPLTQRSTGIEQLTLPRHFATMPGSTEMPRFEHIFGSVVLARKLIAGARESGADISPDEALVKQLRTFVSDLGHTAFSHLGDWLFQGYGGTEDQHDIELMQMLEEGGVLDTLRNRRIEPTSVVFPEISDWIECPQPDLCIDRIDYGAREIARWVSGEEPARQWNERFRLIEDQIVMPSLDEAKLFGVKYGLLATEHWGHPAHRLQLQLFGELVRSAVVRDLPVAGFYNLKHPRDALYAIDADVLAVTRQVGLINYDLHAVMLDIARSQRKIFATGREQELGTFLSHYEHDRVEEESLHFPHPLEARHWTTEYSGTVPSDIEFVPAAHPGEVTDFGRLPYTLDVFLPALKPRQIDPLYLDKGQVHRTSENDASYQRLMTEQRAFQSQSYVARLYAAPRFIERLKQNLRIVQEEWKEALSHERATPDQRRQLFRDMGRMAVGHRMIHLSLLGG